MLRLWATDTLQFHALKLQRPEFGDRGREEKSLDSQLLAENTENNLRNKGASSHEA